MVEYLSFICKTEQKPLSTGLVFFAMKRKRFIIVVHEATKQDRFYALSALSLQTILSNLQQEIQTYKNLIIS